jgi:hypothetical protein
MRGAAMTRQRLPRPCTLPLALILSRSLALFPSAAPSSLNAVFSSVALFLSISLCLSMLLAGAALAAPAPWWLWESVRTGDKVCSQTPLGPGWRRFLGPYKDSRCEKLIRVQ